MIVIKKPRHMKKYYNKETNTYDFGDEDVEFVFNVNVEADIKAGNINNDVDITARNIKARDINAWNINAWDIKANDISYHTFCIAHTIECDSIKGRRENSIHKSLDKPIVIRKENDNE